MTSAHGIIRGRTIELAEDLGMDDGQPVQVDVQIVPSARQWGNGILRSAGAWKEYPELDNVMEKIQEIRHLDTRQQAELK